MAGVTNVAFRTLCRELEQARAGTVSVSVVARPAGSLAGRLMVSTSSTSSPMIS